MPDAQPQAASRGTRKVRTGIVTSNRMAKTIVVRVANLVEHTKYSRVIHQTSSFKVHDESNSAAIGDRVKIMETRPISKDKRWRLVEIVTKASSAPPVPDDPSQLPQTKPAAQPPPEEPAAS